MQECLENDSLASIDVENRRIILVLFAIVFNAKIGTMAENKQNCKHTSNMRKRFVQIYFILKMNKFLSQLKDRYTFNLFVFISDIFWINN